MASRHAVPIAVSAIPATFVVMNGAKREADLCEKFIALLHQPINSKSFSSAVEFLFDAGYKEERVRCFAAAGMDQDREMRDLIVNLSPVKAAYLRQRYPSSFLGESYRGLSQVH